MIYLGKLMNLFYHNRKHSTDTFINKWLQELNCFFIIQVQTKFILNLKKRNYLMLKLCTLISPGERIKNIVGPVTLMSHVGQERITRDITISVSDPSLKASLCHSGGGGGEWAGRVLHNATNGSWSGHPLIGQVLIQSSWKLIKSVVVKRLCWISWPKAYLFNCFIWLQSNVWYICIHH